MTLTIRGITNTLGTIIILSLVAGFILSSWLVITIASIVLVIGYEIHQLYLMVPRVSKPHSIYENDKLSG